MGTTWAPASQAGLWMDVLAAARYAGVDRDDLQVAVNTRQLPASNCHPRNLGTWMVKLADVDAWLLTRLQPAT